VTAPGAQHSSLGVGFVVRLVKKRNLHGQPQRHHGDHRKETVEQQR